MVGVVAVVELVAISLSILGYFQSFLPLTMIFWFISGLGGGTVFCLTRINKQLSLQFRTEIEFWEDVGQEGHLGRAQRSEQSI